MLNGSASLGISTSVLKALPGKLDIKRHSPSILFIWVLTVCKSTCIWVSCKQMVIFIIFLQSSRSETPSGRRAEDVGSWQESSNCVSSTNERGQSGAMATRITGQQLIKYSHSKIIIGRVSTGLKST